MNDDYCRTGNDPDICSRNVCIVAGECAYQRRPVLTDIAELTRQLSAITKAINAAAGGLTMTYTFRGIEMPPHMLAKLHAWVERGQRPGSFLQAVLRNDFVMATFNADENNAKLLPVYAAWVYNECPSPAWGSEAKMAAWERHSGQVGKP